MQHGSGLRAFDGRWAEIAAGTANAPESDVRLSLAYYCAAHDPGSSGAVSSRVRGWVEKMVAVDRFVAAYGVLPRDGRRARAIPRSDDEVLLAGFMRRQRRARERLTAYQRERLELLPGFGWWPVEDRWDDRHDAYARFLVAHGRPPRRHGGTGEEGGLAVWMRDQSVRLRRDRLPAHRAAQLHALRTYAKEIE
jgi:hypothetical protein